jgi:hypothetical protein
MAVRGLARLVRALPTRLESAGERPSPSAELATDAARPELWLSSSAVPLACHRVDLPQPLAPMSPALSEVRPAGYATSQSC